MCTSSEDTFIWIHDHIHDKSHFTSRYLQNLSTKFGITPENLARIHVCFIAVVCLTSLAHFFANALLVLFPFLLIFIFPEESPTVEKLQLYFTIFGGITVFDRYFETIPLYYLTKLLLFLLMFVPNYEFAYRLEKARSSTSKKDQSLKTNNDKPTSSKKSVTKSKSSAKSTSVQSQHQDKATSTRKAMRNETIKKTIIEEYFREEELLSPRGTVIHRKVTGPFQRIVSESSESAKIDTPTSS